MKRREFTLAAIAAAAAAQWPWAASAQAISNLKMMIPANPGGGWDGTGRALGKALQESGMASSITYENKGGAAGAIGLAQQRHETESFEIVGHADAAQLRQRRKQIDELDERPCRLAAFHAGRGDDERRVAAALEKRVLVPPLPLAQVISVVAEEDDDRVLRQVESIERVQ